MGEFEFSGYCKEAISQYYEQERKENCPFKDIYIVWFSKTLQNAKGLFSTNHHDHLYFEMTYNGDKCELYMDVYDKVKNQKIKI